MKLLEYQSKKILKRYGIPVPEGKIVTNPLVAKQFIKTVQSDCILKAQVQSEGRSKTGGIKLIKSENEIDSAITDMLMLKFNGLPTGLILIEQAIHFSDVFNLSIHIDPYSAKPKLELAHLIKSAHSLSEGSKNQLKKESIEINPIIGLLEYQIRHLTQSVELPKPIWGHFGQVVKGSWRMFIDLDMEYLEINPLALSGNQQLVALNVNIIIDEYALYRQNELGEMIDYSANHPIEVEALKGGFSFKKLDGDVGSLANGGALAQTTMDLIHQSGGKPANYLDVGACTSVERLGAAFRLLISDEQINSILINYYGAITPCDVIAAELLKVRDLTNYSNPVSVFFSGLSSEEGIALLSNQRPFLPELFHCERSLITWGKAA